MNPIVIDVNNVSKIFHLTKPRGISGLIKKRTNPEQFGLFKTLDKISFQVTKGEVLGIIGLNGSGKTTLLRIIAGVYKPNSGSVTVKGRLSPLLQLGTGFQGELNARENIIMNGLLLGVSRSFIEDRVENIIQYAELEKFTQMKVKHYSSGMRARLGFATAMQIEPDILLVDEIMSVGDKEFRKKSLETFRSMKENKKTILFATHNIDSLSEFSDRVLLINKGKMVMIGEPKEVLNKYKEIKS